MSSDQIISVRVHGVTADPTTNQFLMLLIDDVGKRLLPIVIGQWEAQSIAWNMQGVELQRPLTHDLFRSVLKSANLEVSRIVINDLRENTFYAQIDALWAGFLWGFVLVVTIIWFGTQFYTLPYLMEQEDQRLRVALRNGLLTMLAAPVYSLILLGLAAVLIALGLVFVIPLIFGLPAAISVLGTRAVQERMEAYGVRERDEA